MQVSNDETLIPEQAKGTSSGTSGRKLQSIPSVKKSLQKDPSKVSSFKSKQRVTLAQSLDLTQGDKREQPGIFVRMSDNSVNRSVVIDQKDS